MRSTGFYEMYVDGASTGRVAYTGTSEAPRGCGCGEWVPVEAPEGAVVPGVEVVAGPGWPENMRR